MSTRRLSSLYSGRQSAGFGHCGEPLIDCAATNLHAVSREDILQAITREMVPEPAHHHVRQLPGCGQPFVDRLCRLGSGYQFRFIVFFRAGIHGPAVDDHLEFGWDVIQLPALFPANQLQRMAVMRTDPFCLGQRVLDDFLLQAVGDQTLPVRLAFPPLLRLVFFQCLFDQLLQLTRLKQQWLVRIEPFTLLAL